MSETLQAKEYEIAFLTKEEDGAQAIRKSAEDFGFSITNPGEIRHITLAYPIEKEQGAWFGYFRFSASPEAIKGFSDELSLESVCLRHLIVSDPPQKSVERPMRPTPIKRTQAKESLSPQSEAPEQKPQTDMVTNEELEKKLEEILK